MGIWKPFSFLCGGMKTLGIFKDLQPWNRNKGRTAKRYQIDFNLNIERIQLGRSIAGFLHPQAPARQASLTLHLCIRIRSEDYLEENRNGDIHRNPSPIQVKHINDKTAVSRHVRAAVPDVSFEEQGLTPRAIPLRPDTPWNCWFISFRWWDFTRGLYFSACSTAQNVGGWILQNFSPKAVES